MQLFQTVQTSGLISHHSHITCSSHWISHGPQDYRFCPPWETLTMLFPTQTDLVPQFFAWQIPVSLSRPRLNVMTSKAFQMTLSNLAIILACSLFSWHIQKLWFVFFVYQFIYYLLHLKIDYMKAEIICLAQHCILGARTVVLVAEISDVICGLGDWLSAGWSPALHDLPWLIR